METSGPASSGERHSLVPNNDSAPGSRHASLAVPLLDEESLKANNGTPGLSLGGFTLVSQTDENFKNAVSSKGNGSESMSQSPNMLSKTLDHNQIYTMLQQQQAVAMAAAQLEQAYNQTCYLLQQCSHNALLTVLMSLLNDYPTTLVQPIRARVEQVLAHPMSPSVSSRQSNSVRKPGSNFVPNSGAAPWTPSNMHGSAAQTPTANGTPGAHRRGRGHKGKEEEQEMCSIHNNMRAMKHLQLNLATGLYECIHGFHCLVDGPVDVSPKREATTTPSVPNGATRSSNPPPSGDGQPFVPATLQPPPPPPQQQQQAKSETRFSATEVQALRMLGYSLGNNNANNGSNGSTGLQSPGQRRDNTVCHRDPEPGIASGQLTSASALGGGYTVVGDDRNGSGSSPLDARLNMDLPSLEYLLQSVRDIDDD
ncbi:hypothetical protein ABL78_6742 [Leptomonas seymouri]|uniref:Uncharacterized protein n=1 Tax=Leptomonas seymouri TaxID=5684 RepID=A0A0N1I1K6_LEPSE|nr:hypothetical protein ABL78_6742 [Leptomonas seymouri]|eukprot:KPI84202.1 hypothetical protein ABL78_6742 [Leptomonas seymouri]